MKVLMPALLCVLFMGCRTNESPEQQVNDMEITASAKSKLASDVGLTPLDGSSGSVLPRGAPLTVCLTGCPEKTGKTTSLLHGLTCLTKSTPDTLPLLMGKGPRILSFLSRKAVESMSPKTQPEVTVRIATPLDIPACGQICYDAFSTLNAAHGFPCDFPVPEAAKGVISLMFSAPGFYCVVAESDGRVVGSNVLDERSVIHGVGPIGLRPKTGYWAGRLE